MKETIELPIAWIRGMKKHVIKIEENKKDGWHLDALLGYLSSLDMYIDEE